MSGKPIDAEDIAVLLRLQAALPDVGLNGWFEGVRVLARVIEHLTAAQQQGQAVAECHCATCTCAPGMTPAVRFDTSPAAQEGTIREHLIALGWTPPNTAPPPSVPVVPDWITGDGMQGIKAEAHFLTQHKEEAVQRAGKRLLDRADKIIAALSQQPAPSAPVGVDAPGSRSWMAEVCRAAALSLAAHGVRNDQLSKVADWIAQQPAAPSAPVGVEGFEEWYASVDARFWNNWDACNAAFHAGKRAALAPLQAKVEALRAEVDLRDSVIATHAADTREYQKRISQAESRAERLAEALRGMMDEYEALHAEYDLGDCQATVDARAALRDHDQEGKDG